MASRFLVPSSSGGGLSSVDPFLDLHREMNRLFDDAFRGIGLPASFTGGSQGISMPRLDMHEQDNELCVEADLPGVKASDVDLQIDDDVLTISAETKSDSQREQQNYHVMERVAAATCGACSCRIGPTRSRSRPISRTAC